MTASDARPGLFARLRHPQTTVRWRLTLLYGGLFLVCGAALLAITYVTVERATVTREAPIQGIVNRAVAGYIPSPGSLPRELAQWDFQLGAHGGQNASVPKSARGPNPSSATVPPRARASGPGGSRSEPQIKLTNAQAASAIKHLLGTKPGRNAITFVGSEQRIADLHQLVIVSGIALALMALISAALGWLVAGRVLRPLRTMTTSTQQISEANLHRRLALEGPRDELRQLADTIDGLLERLEGAFDAQRRFVANASHELRTPLTSARALLELVLSDPHATVETFRDTCEQVLDESEEQEQLIDALLALAHGQRGIDRRETVDLAAVVGAIVESHELDAAARGLHLDVSLEPAFLSGDRRLIERLVTNLLENAIRHNIAGGDVRLGVGTDADGASLVVANSGPVVPADAIERLMQPFQRLTQERVGRDGFGLGLSIVAAIATAHDATLDVRPGIDGGLRVEVRFESTGTDSVRPGPRDEAPREPSAGSDWAWPSDRVHVTRQ